MKPVLNMEERKPVAVSPQNVIEQPEKQKRNRLVTGLVIGLVAVIGIALVTGLSEAKQLYKIDDGKVVEEVSKVTDTEVIIKVPNVVETVFDYKNGIMVERYINSETKVKSACFARYLNETTAPTTDATRYKDEELTLNEKTVEQPTQKWAATARKLAKYLVSQSVAEMCKDTDIFWMERVEDNGDIEKREACYDIGYKYVCYPRSYRCSYYCYFDNFCVNPYGTIYMYETQGWYCKKGCYGGARNPVC